MSCFGGQMKTYKCFAIDRFDGFNLNASSFFLSHCHSDHMIGLESDLFVSALKAKRAARLYMSEISKVLLLQDDRYKKLTPYILDLPIEEPKLLHFEDSDNKTQEILVTLLPAGHCPGSVMFLFEGNEGVSLYTGDFRLPKGSAARMKYLHSGGSLKKVDHVYFDSTFCIPDAFFIPSREQCLEAIISVIKQWICKGSNHIARLRLSAKYGYEYVFEEIYKQLHMKVYCPRTKLYKFLPRISKALTYNPASTQVYAGFKHENIKSNVGRNFDEQPDLETCEERIESKEYLNLTLSTLYFTHAASPDDIQLKMNDNHYRLCFSFHSSLSEVRDFLSYIKPDHIHANVIPRPGETFQSVEDRMRRLCFDKQNQPDRPLEFSPIGKLKQNKETVKRRVTNKHIKLMLNDDSDDEYTTIVRKRNKTCT